MPAWARTHSDVSSISRMRSSRFRSTTIPWWIGSVPPCVPEPPPHGITGTRASWASFSTRAASSADPGWTMTSGRGVATPRSSVICGTHDASTE
jgi:hypothetical protein